MATSSRRPVVTPARLVLMLLILFHLAYFGLFAVRRHLAFETGAFDLGVYAQPLWNFIQGRGFSTSLIADNGPLRWATHVEPILFLIAPLYKLWPDPRTLLWVQVTGLSLTGLPLFGLAVRRLQNEWAALAIVMAFFLMPATQVVTLFDFHAVALAPLFLLSALYFLDRALSVRGSSLWLWPEAISREGQAGSLPYKRAYGLAALFFLLALSTKEDISLHVFMVGLYLLLLRRRWWEGGTLIMVGLVWFYVAFQIVIPAFRTGGGQSIFLAWFETLGSTPTEVMLSPITAPDKVLALFLRPDSLPPLAMITVPLALLPVVGLPFLLMAAPSLAFSLLSQNPTIRQLETWHYAAPMLPFIMLATIDGMARVSHLVSQFIPERSRTQAQPVAGFGFDATRFVPPSALSGKMRLNRTGITFLLTLILLSTALIYHHLRGYSFLARSSPWPEVTAHHQLGRDLAATIPPEASVLAQAQLVPHVAHRHKVAIWSGPLETEYEYIWLDLSHPRLPNRFNAHGELLTGMVIEPAFGPVAAEDGYLLLKRGVEREPIPAELFTFTEFDQLPDDAQPFEAVFGDVLKLIGVKPEVNRLATSETEPQVVLFFEVLQKPVEDYQLFVYLLDQNRDIIGTTDYAQPALFWWPTSRWQAGDRRQVRVNTVPWWTGDKTVFGYAIGFSHNDDPWNAAARLPVTVSDGVAAPSGTQPLDSDTVLPVVAFRRWAGLIYPQPLSILQ